MALKPAIHGRDHCPGGADPIPCLGGYPYIFRTMDTPQAIGAGIPEYVTWLDTDITQSDNHFALSDDVSIEIITPGVYDFFVGVRWEPFNAVATVRVECQQFEWMPTTYGKGGLYTGGGSLIDQDAMLFVHFQARMLGDEAGQPVAVVVAHEHSSSQNAYSAFLRIARVGSYEGDTGIIANGDGLLF